MTEAGLSALAALVAIAGLSALAALAAFSGFVEQCSSLPMGPQTPRGGLKQARVNKQRIQ